MLLSLALHGALGAFAVREACRELRLGPAAALPCLHAVCPTERAAEMEPATLELEVPPELLPVSEPAPRPPPEPPPEEPPPEEPEILEAPQDAPPDAQPPELTGVPSWAALRRRRLVPEPRVTAPPAPSPPDAAAPAPAAAAAAPTPPSAVQRRRTPHVPRTAALARLSPPLTVSLLLTLEADGRVSEVAVERSSGAGVFDEAARAWVLAQWSFEPLGRRVRIRVPVHLRG